MIIIVKSHKMKNKLQKQPDRCTTDHRQLKNKSKKGPTKQPKASLKATTGFLILLLILLNQLKTESIIPNCRFYSFTNGCIQCMSGYFKTGYKPKEGSFTECKKCQNNCAVCQEPGTPCIECFDGYQLLEATNTCIECPEQCAECSTTGKCKECNSGYYLAAVDQLCYNCPNNCQECSARHTCTLCDENFKNEHGHCVKEFVVERAGFLIFVVFLLIFGAAYALHELWTRRWFPDRAEVIVSGETSMIGRARGPSPNGGDLRSSVVRISRINEYQVFR